MATGLEEAGKIIDETDGELIRHDKKALENKGIYIGTHISECAGVADISFGDIKRDIISLSTKDFPVLSDSKAKEMKAEILT